MFQQKQAFFLFNDFNITSLSFRFDLYMEPVNSSFAEYSHLQNINCPFNDLFHPNCTGVSYSDCYIFCSFIFVYFTWKSGKISTGNARMVQKQIKLKLKHQLKYNLSLKKNKKKTRKIIVLTWIQNFFKMFFLAINLVCHKQFIYKNKLDF